MSKIIVTGGLGFIGSHFINYINENTDHEVLIVDKLTYAANKNNIKQPTTILEKDICEFGKLKSSRDGLRYFCKKCRNNIEKTYEKNAEIKK